MAIVQVLNTGSARDNILANYDICHLQILNIVVASKLGFLLERKETFDTLK